MQQVKNFAAGTVTAAKKTAGFGQNLAAMITVASGVETGKYIESDNCVHCQNRFDSTLKKRHCKRCLNSVCESCSPRKMKLSANGFEERICDVCETELENMEEMQELEHEVLLNF